MDSTADPRPSSVRSDGNPAPGPDRLAGPPFDRGGRRFGGPRRRPDFLRFWAAHGISQVGSQVTLLALPLIAALTLRADPFAVGLLAAAGTAPSFLVGLLAGVWVDRFHRRPMLIAADLGQAALLLLIPIASVFDRLSMGLLSVVALLAGTLAVFANVASASYLPSLVPRADLVEANGRLEASRSTAQIAGPGIGGTLIGVAGAPIALAADAASFLASALLLARIRTPEAPPRPRTGRPIRDEIGEGIDAVRRHPVLRPLILSATTTEFFAYVFFAVYVLYFTRELGLTATAVGLVFATGGVGALIGAVIAAPIGRRLGPGPTVVVAQLLFGVSGMVIPLAAVFPAIALEMVVASEFLQWLTIIVVNVNALGLRQALTPDRLHGRVNATFRFLVGGSQPLGSLLGGLLGGAIGLTGTLVVGELGMLLAAGWLFASPLPRLRHLPP